MSKSTKGINAKAAHPKSASTKASSKKEAENIDDKEEDDTTAETPTATAQPVEENLAQPDKNNADPQAYIKENAKGGESITDPLTRKAMREGINVETSGEESE